eukprot:CAMPEP_0171656650 /NCGR_PEP_ID=MMETSP0990-20121206/41731_1 /TAXON_ID=483369 /ORGANISM="non described non described, Strain CCMP2098" /LENGTH=50 /DNA_ID=CAMNT_0012237211 /DNA_START=80 /DNA_END=229 /DNA_ORIENTATION=-
MSDTLMAFVSAMRCLSWPLESAALSEPAKSITCSTPSLNRDLGLAASAPE